MPKWLLNYHAYLVSRTESIAPGERKFHLDSIVLPWIIPVVLVWMSSEVFRLDGRARIILMLPVSLICIGGILYSLCVFLSYGFRADMRRMHEAKQRSISACRVDDRRSDEAGR